MGFLPEEFSGFISPQCNRLNFIRSWLSSKGIDSTEISIDGKNHILVQFEKSAYNPKFRIKTVIAHYDRVEGSPGANDNSAAVWQIMNWAVQLKSYQYFHNVRIFFTDGEELGSNTGVTEQGAFGIASTFQRLGIKDDVYVFDACGRGNIPVLSMLNLGPKTPAAFVKTASDLYVRTQNILKKATGGRWLTLPTPYSDNASFLACGIPAVAITMLPDEEASLYAVNTSNLPLTWKLFHSEKDNEHSLTPESFFIMEKILTVLAETKIPC
ncbi:MAG: M28 family peptidase [Spirochaetales bacterium]|nr:M28 family peptidase [Spirochaetales bacterium]